MMDCFPSTNQYTSCHKSKAYFLLDNICAIFVKIFINLEEYYQGFYSFTKIREFAVNNVTLRNVAPSIF